MSMICCHPSEHSLRKRNGQPMTSKIPGHVKHCVRPFHPTSDRFTPTGYQIEAPPNCHRVGQGCVLVGMILVRVVVAKSSKSVAFTNTPFHLPTAAPEQSHSPVRPKRYGSWH